MDFECFMDEQVVIKETTIIKEEVEIDQNYNPESENAQSGKAVAEAIQNIPKEVDQTYNATSENAQSGKAVAEAVKNKLDKKNNNLGDLEDCGPAVYAEDDRHIVSHGALGDSKTELIRVDDVMNSRPKPKPYYIPRRDERGNLWSNSPVNDYDVTTKEYVDPKIDRLQKLVANNEGEISHLFAEIEGIDNELATISNKVPIIPNSAPYDVAYIQKSGNGSVTAENVSTLPIENDSWRVYPADMIGFIATRNGKGNLVSGIPTEDLEVTNKKYVDDSIANIEISGGIGAIDQEYKPESENAQSGKAVTEALNKYIPIQENWAPLDTAYIQKSNSDSSEGVSTLYIENKSWREEYPTDMPEFIATRNERSNLISNTPEIDLEVANKKYVDDAIVNIDINGKLDKMTDKTSNTASGKMVPKFYAIDKINDVVSDTLLRGSWNADGNTIPLRNGNGQIVANTSKDDSSALVNLNYLKNYVAEHIPTFTFIPRKLNHTWKNANETVQITRSNMYFCCSSSNSGDVQVIDGNNSAVTDAEGDSISVGKVFILFVPENTTTYNSVRGYMCFYISAKQGSGILNPQIDGSAGNIFIKKEDMEDGNHFIKTGGGMNVWTLPFDI